MELISSQYCINISVLHMKVSKLNHQASNTETCITGSEWYKRISKDVHWFRESKTNQHNKATLHQSDTARERSDIYM
jgi:hypothetical protein